MEYEYGCLISDFDVDSTLQCKWETKKKEKENCTQIKIT